MTTTGDPLRFPYMVFARGAGGGATHSLLQSGMPAADPALLGPAELPDLEFAGTDALQDLGLTMGLASEVKTLLPAMPETS